jgi:anaerobic selenocysteine-containing dehydrogenase
LCARVDAHFDPLPIWYQPLEEAAVDGTSFPLHAVTQRPMAMYHSWGSQNAWLRQIHGHNRLYMNRRTAERQDLRDDDWVWVISHHGRIRVQLKLMEGVNEDTVWTWNAIGKRKGAWNLATDAAESRRGFLLNHVISELLPPQPDGHRYANSDPITGQAAWYDLRVRVEKAKPEEAGETYPVFATLTPPQGTPPRPAVLTYGAEFREPLK